MTKTWQRKKSGIAYRNPWYGIRHDEVVRPDGQRGTYDVIEHPGFVLIIPRVGKRYCLVRQYRYPIRRYSWEFPGGSLNTAERPLDAAKRELEEECGLRSGKWTKLGYFWATCGIADCKCTAYLADDCTDCGYEGKRDGSEADMKIRWFTSQQVKNMIRSGLIKDSEVIAGWSILKMAGGRLPGRTGAAARPQIGDRSAGKS